MIWSEITVSWDNFRVANLFGTGTYVVPAFISLSVLGLAFVRMRRFEISAFLAGIVYFVATVTFTYTDARFYIPIFFLLVALAVLPAEWAVNEALKMHFSISTLGVLVIFLLTCIGYPSQSGFKPKSESIPSLGRSSLRKRQWKINLVRGAKGIHSLLSGRSWYRFVRHRSSVLERVVAEAIRSGSD